MTFNGHFTLNFVLSRTLKSKIHLFTYMDSAMIIPMDKESMRAGQLVNSHRRSTRQSDKALPGNSRNMSNNNYIDTLCWEALTRYNDNHYMMITWKLWNCHLARVEVNIIIQYYLFPHWLFNGSGEDDHFATFGGRIALLLLCHVLSTTILWRLCNIKLSWYGSADAGLLSQCHVHLNN